MELDREDPKVEQALKHFRESVKAWSEHEISVSRRPVPARRGIFAIRMPLLNWTVAALVAVAAVTVPVTYHEHEVHVRDLLQAKQAEAKRVAEEAAKQQAYAMDDEELLKHVDRDIAQQTPDAMQSLASLMTDTKSN